MALYARPSWQLTRQVTTDVFVVVWTGVWWLAGRALDAVIRGLAAPSRAIQDAAGSMQDGFEEAARSVETVPLAGPSLRQPFDAAASGLQQVWQSAHDQVVGIEQVATLTGLLTFAIPVAIILALWLPARIRFIRNSRATARFISIQPNLELLALRALATQPFHRLAQVSNDPLAAWRDGDEQVIDALAELELRRNGLRRPRVARLPDPPAIEGRTQPS